MQGIFSHACGPSSHWTVFDVAVFGTTISVHEARQLIPFAAIRICSTQSELLNPQVQKLLHLGAEQITRAAGATVDMTMNAYG